MSWLHALTAVRNVCAHQSRLWNRELAVKPELPVAWKASGIGNDRFYVIALIIQTLLADIAPVSRWGEQLKALFNEHPTVNLPGNAISCKLADSPALEVTTLTAGHELRVLALYFWHHGCPENFALSGLPCTGCALCDLSRRALLSRASRSATSATEIR